MEENRNLYQMLGIPNGSSLEKVKEKIIEMENFSKQNGGSINGNIYVEWEKMNRDKKAYDKDLKIIIGKNNDDLDSDLGPLILPLGKNPRYNKVSNNNFRQENVKNVNHEKISDLKKRRMKLYAALGAIMVIGTSIGCIVLGCKNKPNYKDDDSYAVDINNELYTFTYIVQPGDTYTELLEKFNLWNDNYINLKKELYPGDKLKFETSDKEMAEYWQNEYKKQTIKPIVVEWEEYVVKEGDTPYSIANLFGISIQDLIDFNPGKVDKNIVYLGDTIKIPTKTLYGSDALEYEESISNSSKSY